MQNHYPAHSSESLDFFNAVTSRHHVKRESPSDMLAPCGKRIKLETFDEDNETAASKMEGEHPPTTHPPEVTEQNVKVKGPFPQSDSTRSIDVVEALTKVPIKEENQTGVGMKDDAQVLSGRESKHLRSPTTNTGELAENDLPVPSQINEPQKNVPKLHNQDNDQSENIQPPTKQCKEEPMTNALTPSGQICGPPEKIIEPPDIRSEPSVDIQTPPIGLNDVGNAEESLTSQPAVKSETMLAEYSQSLKLSRNAIVTCDHPSDKYWNDVPNNQDKDVMEPRVQAKKHSAEATVSHNKLVKQSSDAPTRGSQPGTRILSEASQKKNEKRRLEDRIRLKQKKLSNMLSKKSKIGKEIRQNIEHIRLSFENVSPTKVHFPEQDRKAVKKFPSHKSSQWKNQSWVAGKKRQTNVMKQKSGSRILAGKGRGVLNGIESRIKMTNSLKKDTEIMQELTECRSDKITNSVDERKDEIAAGTDSFRTPGNRLPLSLQRSSSSSLDTDQKGELHSGTGPKDTCSQHADECGDPKDANSLEGQKRSRTLNDLKTSGQLRQYQGLPKRGQRTVKYHMTHMLASWMRELSLKT